MTLYFVSVVVNVTIFLSFILTLNISCLIFIDFFFSHGTFSLYIGHTILYSIYPLFLFFGNKWLSHLWNIHEIKPHKSFIFIIKSTFMSRIWCHYHMEKNDCEKNLFQFFSLQAKKIFTSSILIYNLNFFHLMFY